MAKHTKRQTDTISLVDLVETDTIELPHSYYLEVVEGPYEGRIFALDNEHTIIGRHPHVTIQLKNDQRVSGYHCELLIDGRGVRVRDLQSRNGTYFGPSRVYDAYLPADQPLHVGENIIHLRIQEDATSQIPIQCMDDSATLVGQSPAMKQLFGYMRALARTDLSTVFLGETGVGKSTIAKAIHDQSDRANGPFIAVNCTATPHDLFESLYFGHMPHAFTGAGPKRHVGYFERADGGTLFLDEIGDLPLKAQAKLLKAIDERCVLPLKAEKPVPVDIKLFCATNKDLERAVEQGTFRRDLYYRIAHAAIEIPPLYERPEDIELLVPRILQELQPTRQFTLSAQAMHKLQTYRWPGNVRELRSVLDRSIKFHQVFSASSSTLNNLPTQLEAHHIQFDNKLAPYLDSKYKKPETAKAPTEEEIPLYLLAQLDGPSSLDDARQALDRFLIHKTLEGTDWNISEAHKNLGISRTRIYELMKKLNISRPS